MLSCRVVVFLLFATHVRTVRGQKGIRQAVNVACKTSEGNIRIRTLIGIRLSHLHNMVIIASTGIGMKIGVSLSQLPGQRRLCPGTVNRPFGVSAPCCWCRQRGRYCRSGVRRRLRGIQNCAGQTWLVVAALDRRLVVWICSSELRQTRPPG